MPVDDAILETTIDDLQIKYQDAREAYRDVAAILEAAQGIAQKDDPGNPGQKLMPKDPILGGPLDVPRRQAIYDKVIADLAAL